MSKYKGHTPGPWKWYDDDELVSVDVERQHKESVLGLEMYSSYAEDGEYISGREADRNLIADAPKLLAQRDALLKIAHKANSLVYAVCQSAGQLHMSITAAEELARDIEVIIKECEES